MYIPARERQLLKLLLNEQSPHDLHELAAFLDVSTRTVQRDLKGLGGMLNQYKLSLQKDTTNKGFYLLGDDHNIQQLKADLSSMEPSDYTPEERQLLLLVALLEKQEPIKLFTLADELNVTVATVSHDLTKVEEWLSSFHLTLIRRRGYGVEVEGSETDIRRSLSSLITENVSESSFYQSFQTESSDHALSESISDRLLGIVDMKKFNWCKRLLRIFVPTQMDKWLMYLILVSLFTLLSPLNEFNRVKTFKWMRINYMPSNKKMCIV